MLDVPNHALLAKTVKVVIDEGGHGQPQRDHDRGGRRLNAGDEAQQIVAQNEQEDARDIRLIALVAVPDHLFGLVADESRESSRRYAAPGPGFSTDSVSRTSTKNAMSPATTSSSNANALLIAVAGVAEIPTTCRMAATMPPNN